MDQAESENYAYVFSESPSCLASFFFWPAMEQTFIMNPITLFCSSLFQRYQGENEGLPGSWSQLDDFTIWKWNQRNPCRRNGNSILKMTFSLLYFTESLLFSFSCFFLFLFVLFCFFLLSFFFFILFSFSFSGFGEKLADHFPSGISLSHSIDWRPPPSCRSQINPLKLEQRIQQMVPLPKGLYLPWKQRRKGRPIEFDLLLPPFRLNPSSETCPKAKLTEEYLYPCAFNVCITSYEMILLEKAVFKKFAWHYIVIDEAHRIKNENSSLSQVMRLFDRYL